MPLTRAGAEPRPLGDLAGGRLLVARRGRRAPAPGRWSGRRPPCGAESRPRSRRSAPSSAPNSSRSPASAASRPSGEAALMPTPRRARGSPAPAAAASRAPAGLSRRARRSIRASIRVGSSAAAVMPITQMKVLPKALAIALCEVPAVSRCPCRTTVRIAVPDRAADPLQRGQLRRRVGRPARGVRTA